jgi:hypothetical protein
VSLSDVDLEVVECGHLVVVTCELAICSCSLRLQVLGRFRFYLVCFTAKESLEEQSSTKLLT